MTPHLTFERLIDYIQRELSPAEDALAYEHLQACARCAADLERETALPEALRAAARREELDMPASLRASVRELLRNEERPAAWWTALARPAFAIPAAALLAMGVAFSLPAFQHGPRIQAGYYLMQHAGQTSAFNDPASTATFAAFVEPAQPPPLDR